MKSILFIFVTIVVSSFARLICAQEIETPIVSDNELGAAFQLGISPRGDGGEEFLIEVARYGHTLHFKSLLNDGSEQKLAELSCELCSKDEALSQARELGALTRCRAEGTMPARLFIDGDAPGYRLAIDGVPLVPPQLGHSLVGGKHVIVAKGQTGKSVRDVIETEPGKHIEIALQSSSFAARNKLRGALILGGLGLTAAAVGTMFLLVNDTCTTAACEQDHQLLAAGWSTIGGGIALEISMIIWLITASRNDELAFEER